MKSYPYIGKGIKSGSTALIYEQSKCVAIESKTWAVADLELCDGINEDYFKNITAEFLANTYGEVKSKEHAEFIVKLATSHGYNLTGRVKEHDAGTFIICGENKVIFFVRESDFHSESVLKQITIPLPPKCESVDECNNEKLFAGVAMIGKGKYRSRNGGKKLKCYKTWENMITRCYVKSSQYYERYGGRGVYVCDEWLNYQNFAEWYLNQKNNSKANFQIDKDLKVIGNKVYSPKTCEIVPSRVNSLLISTNSRRGDLPVGVHALKDKFKASCRDEFGSKVHLGTFKTQTEAFSAYKNFKKGVIVSIANDELKKGNISNDVHKSLVLMEISPFPE